MTHVMPFDDVPAWWSWKVLKCTRAKERSYDASAI